eukprot:jgi/Orpsp1_1/1181987/evm.model.c7180000079416.1
MLNTYRMISLQNIPPLTDKEHDVLLWYDQMNSWRRIQKIASPREMYDWCLIKVQGKAARCLKQAVTIGLLDEIHYPSLEEMRDLLLIEYNMKEDPEDIISAIKNMKITATEDIKTFNQEYLEYYNKLTEEDQKRLSLNDYLDAIINKTNAWKQVKVEDRRKKLNLLTAMEAAEYFDKMEKEYKTKTKGSNSNSNNKNFKNLNSNRNFNNNTFNNPNDFRVNNQNPNIGNNSKNNNYRVQFCKFCNEKGHTRSDCPGYAQFQYLKYRDSVQNQVPNNFNPNFNNYNNNSNSNFNVTPNFYPQNFYNNFNYIPNYNDNNNFNYNNNFNNFNNYMNPNNNHNSVNRDFYNKFNNNNEFKIIIII